MARLAIKEMLKHCFPLFIFTILLSVLTFSINLLRSDVYSDMTLPASLYFILAAIGHSFLFASVLYLIYALLVVLTRSVKFSTVIYLILAIGLQVLFILDGLVFTLYRFHINGFVMDLFLGAGTDVFVFDFWLYLKFALIIISAAVLPYCLTLLIRPYIYRYLNKKRIVAIVGFAVSCLVVSHVGHAVASAARNMSIERSATVLPYFYPLTANSLMKKIGIAVDDEIEGHTFNLRSANLNYPLHPIEKPDSLPSYNILHIVIDSWNPTTFDSITTPEIHQFSKQAAYYSNHFSSHCGTSGGIFGMFFGLPFSYQKDFEIAQLSPLFIDMLVNEGYNIQVFPSATFEKPPFHKRIFRRVPHINTKTEGKTPFERDNKITEMAIDFLKEQNRSKPFYAFIFYDLPHAISIPEECRAKFQPSWDEPDYLALKNDIDRTPFFNLYKNCVYHTDNLIGQVLKQMEESDLLDNTIVIITADHGQEFNENKKNYWGHTSNFSDWQLKVPFILFDPSGRNPQVYNHMTTHYDIIPTILSRYFGVKNSTSDYSLGYDIDNTAGRYPIVVGDNNTFGFVFEDKIVTTNEVGSVKVTDRQLNPIPRSSLKSVELQQAIEIKNRFYK
jgi:membrane-anchored protein YejM (alkaline phosphatase superfamily)